MVEAIHPLVALGRLDAVLSFEEPIEKGHCVYLTSLVSELVTPEISGFFSTSEAFCKDQISTDLCIGGVSASLRGFHGN